MKENSNTLKDNANFVLSTVCLYKRLVNILKKMFCLQYEKNCIYLPNLPHEQDVTQDQFFESCSAVVNSGFVCGVATYVACFGQQYLSEPIPLLIYIHH